MIVWRKSSYSGTQDEADCVEVTGLPGGTPTIGVRDSKQPYGPVLAFSSREFRDLLDHVKGEAIGDGDHEARNDAGIPADQEGHPCVA